MSKKSAFSEGRLLGYDQTGRIVLSYRDGADGKLKSEALDPLELIRRWLLHVLPKGLVRVRHYGWLSLAAHKAFLRVRFLLGLGPYRIPTALKSEPPSCPFCNGVLAKIARIAPQRGPAIVPGDPQGRRMKPIPTIRRFAAACLVRSRTLCIQISRIIAAYGSRCVALAQRPSNTVISRRARFPPPPRRTTEARAALPTALVATLSRPPSRLNKGEKASREQEPENLLSR